MGYKRNKRQGGGNGNGNGDGESGGSISNVFDLVAAETARARARADGSQWYVPESGEDGQSVTLTVRISPSLATAVQVLMDSGKFPYLTKSDLFRHALDTHVLWLYNLGITVPKDALAAHQLINQTTRKTKESVTLTKSVDTLESEIREQVTQGNITQARQTIGVLISRLADFSNSHWKDGILRRLQAQYQHLDERLAHYQPNRW